MGWVLFAKGKHPIMWCMIFPDDIQQCMVTIENTAGDITNSDLEQAGVLAQADVANNLYDLCDCTLTTLNDNIMAVSRNQKGALTSDLAGAYLCRLTSLHRCHHRYCHEVSYIKGEVNQMADTLSH